MLIVERDLKCDETRDKRRHKTLNQDLGFGQLTQLLSTTPRHWQQAYNTTGAFLSLFEDQVEFDSRFGPLKDPAFPFAVTSPGVPPLTTGEQGD